MSKNKDNTNNNKESHKKTESQPRNDNILTKIIATIRNESKELTDAVKGSYGTMKIEKDIELAQSKLSEAKSTLAKMMQKEIKSKHILDIINEKINQQERLITEYLVNKNETQAMKHAKEVVDLQMAKESQTANVIEMTSHIAFLQKQLEHSQRDLKESERELAMLRTSQKVQKATDSIMENIDVADSKLVSAKITLKRIREKHNNNNALQNFENKIQSQYISNKKPNNESKSLLTNNQPETPVNNAEDIIKRIKDTL